LNEAIVTRAQKLYREAGEIVAEEVKLKQKSTATSLGWPRSSKTCLKSFCNAETRTSV